MNEVRKFRKVGDAELLLNETKGGCIFLESRFVEDSLWYSQALTAKLVETSRENLCLHISSFVAQSRPRPAATFKDYMTVQTECTWWVRRMVTEPSRKVFQITRKMGGRVVH